jgi:predicted DNA-binding transcriptional regulator AlpA
MTDRMPAYLSCASLARELDVSETTVNEMVRRGVLPKPYKLSAGCVRWRWNEVEVALASLKAGTQTVPDDPYLKGAQNVAKQQEARRHDA